MRHGKGEIGYTGADKFAGEWRGGLMHGVGTYTWARGMRFKGKWQV